MYFLSSREKSNPSDEFTSAPGVMIIKPIARLYAERVRSYIKTVRFVSCSSKEIK